MELLSKVGEAFLCKLGEKLLVFALSQEDGATFESLQRNIRSLCAKAKDVDEQIKIAEVCSSKKKRKRAVEDWLEQVQLVEIEIRNLGDEMKSEWFVKRFFGRGRAKKLDSIVSKLDEKCKDFGELVIDSYNVKEEKLLTSGLVGQEFEKNLEGVMRLLLVDKVPSIGVFGMGGVGKTTLVKHVNNRLIEQTQERVNVVWITVSQEFTVAILQDKIAEVLGIGPLDESNEDRRASRLNRVLSLRKNLILIFDDVWDQLDFKKLGDPLSTNGCRLLITTRSQKICHQLDCQKVVKVNTLKEHEAWNLFNEALGRDKNVSPQVEEIAKSLVKLCNGLPLGIITLARSMKGEHGIHVWRDALAKLRGSITGLEEQVFNVLKHSFDRLDPSERTNGCYSKLQLCFLCCSLFPEDWCIPRDDLIEMFILKELLDRRKSRRELFDQGHAKLDQLVNVCLLERVNRDQVKMHDLVRAMALRITERTTKVIAGNRSLTEIPNDGEWTRELETMSLMMNKICIIPNGMSPECPNLTTLILHYNRGLEFIPKSFFLQMCNLSILDLSFTKIKKLPDEVSNMEGLKALILGNCRSLAYVPCLRKLEKLRKLQLSWTALQEVPRGTEKLINLQFLALDNIFKLKVLLNGFVLNFRYLQCILLPNHIHVQVEELSELNHLEEFVGRLNDVREFFKLTRRRQILAYSIAVQQLDGSPAVNSKFRGYNKLGLIKCDLKKLKDEDGDILDVGVLRHLFLRRCVGSSNSLMQDFAPRLINPASLESLDISYCEEVESIFINEKFRGVLHPPGSMSESPPVCQTVFTSLTQLEIANCKNIKSLGVSVLELPNLVVIVITCCKQIEEIFEVIEEGQSGRVEATLSNLKHMFFRGLPKLKSLCNATIVCSSLRQFSIVGCGSLNKLPLVFGQLDGSPPPDGMRVHLQSDEKEWWEKLELGHPTYHSLLQPFIHWDLF